MAITVTKKNFKTEVMESEVPVLIDFWAEWCRPCQMLTPILDDLAKDIEGIAKIAKVNIDEQPEIAQAFQVMSIPTLVVMNKGEVVNAAVGVRKKDELREMLAV